MELTNNLSNRLKILVSVNILNQYTLYLFSKQMNHRLCLPLWIFSGWAPKAKPRWLWVASTRAGLGRGGSSLKGRRRALRQMRMNHRKVTMCETYQLFFLGFFFFKKLHLKTGQLKDRSPRNLQRARHLGGWQVSWPNLPCTQVNLHNLHLSAPRQFAKFWKSTKLSIWLASSKSTNLTGKNLPSH